MAKPPQGPKGGSGSDHWNSGTLGQRALWALFEQGAHLAGNKAAKTQFAKGMGDKVYAALGGNDNGLFTGGALIAAQTFMNADVVGRILANRFNLPADKIVELSNEGLDEFVRGFMSAAQQIDPALPIDQQNQQLRTLADAQLDAYLQKVAKNNPIILRDVIVVQERGREAIHELNCSYERPRLDARETGVRKVRLLDVPATASPAVCECRRAISYKGRLHDVFEHLRQAGRGKLVDQVRAELRHESYDSVRDKFWSMAGLYDQTTAGMVEEALRETDPKSRHAMILNLVGMTPKTGAEGIAVDAAKKAKEFWNELSDPASPTRQKIDKGITNFGTQGRSFSAAARRRS